MKYVKLPGTDLTVSAVAYGTGSLGVDMTDAESARLVNAYRDAGGNLLDTAHVYAFWTRYGAGSSECAIARYLKANGKGDLVVATKGGHPGAPGYRVVDRWLDPARVHSDIQDSLGRLETDRLDLYYLHRDDTRFTVAEIIDMLNREIDSGTIGAIAASNWTRDRLEEANGYASSRGLHGFVASQNQWSYAVRETDPPLPHGAQMVYVGRDDLDYHRRTGLPLCAYTATAGGYFADPEGRAGRFDTAGNRERLARARTVAAARGITANQVGLAWMLHQPFPCIPITGTTSVAHLQENLGAADVALDEDELGLLESVGGS